MSEIITVGLDLEKNVFQVHGADTKGAAVLRKKWTCRVLLPPRLLIYAALASKAKGLFQPRAECFRRAL